VAVGPGGAVLITPGGATLGGGAADELERVSVAVRPGRRVARSRTGRPWFRSHRTGPETRPRAGHEIEQPDRRGRRQRAQPARQRVTRRHDRSDQPEWETLWDDLAELQQPARTGRHFLRFLVLVLAAVRPGQVVLRNSADPTRREDWPQHHARLRRKLEAFHRVFRPRINGLDAGDLAPEPTTPWRRDRCPGVGWPC
jgi:hypothetical protein